MANLSNLLAFLAPDEISKYLLAEGAWPERLAAAVGDDLGFEECIAALPLSDFYYTERKIDLLEGVKACLNVAYSAHLNALVGFEDSDRRFLEYSRYGDAGQNAEMGTSDYLGPPI